MASDKRIHYFSTLDPTVTGLVLSCLDVQANKSQTEKDYRELFLDLATAFNGWRQELPDADAYAVQVGGGTVEYVAVSWVEGGSTTTINARKLLERGVDPTAIEYATERKPRAGHLRLDRVAREEEVMLGG